MRNKTIYIQNFIIFWGILFIGISYVAVNVIVVQNFLKSIKFIGMILLLINFLLSIKNLKLPKKKVFFLFVLLIIAFIIYLKYSIPIILEFVLIALNCLKKDFYGLIKIDFMTKIILLCSIVALSLAGSTNGIFEVVMRGDIDRYSLGFYHPNTLSMYVMIILIEYMYIKRNSLNIKNIALIILSSFFSTKITDTRTTFYCIVILLFICCFERLFRKLFDIKFSFNMIKYSYFILLLLTIIVSIMYLKNIKFAINLNSIFNNRIELQSIFLQKYNVNLLGNYMNYNVTLDNGFLKVLLNFGLIPTLCYGIIYIENFKNSFNDDKLYCWILFIILIYSLSESYMFYVPYNIFWFYVFCKEKVL